MSERDHGSGPDRAAHRLDRIVALAREMLGGSACLAALAEGEGVEILGMAGLSGRWREAAQAHLGAAICRAAAEGRSAVGIEDAAADAGGVGRRLHEAGVAACLVQPISLNGRVAGALAVLEPAPRRWSDEDRRRLGDFAGVAGGEVELRALVRERDAARQEAELLAQEQAHRVKNSLAVAASLVTLSGTEAESAREAVRIARDRIAALSTAHSVLRTREGTGELKTLLETLLSPYDRSGGGGVRLRGAPTPLPADRVTPISLIFHELATHACQHGGLAAAGGGVDLGWQGSDGSLTVEWREAVEPGRPPAGEGAGFGSRLVELSVRQMSGRMQVGRSGEGGLEITLSLPWPGVG